MKNKQTHKDAISRQVKKKKLTSNIYIFSIDLLLVFRSAGYPY